MPSQHYELTFIVSSKVPENETERVVEKVKKLLTDLEAKITGQNPIGRKKFAYPIEHQKHGFYQVYEFDLPGENLAKLNRELKMDKAEVLRYLIIKKMILTQQEIDRQKRAETAADKTPASEKAPKTKPELKKVSLEDLDKKLDEILDKEMVQ